MPVFEGIRLALNQIRAQKLKSFFALIGVFIGVMFLVVVVSVVEGMNKYMEEDFARTIYGLNTITIRRTPSVQMNTSAERRRDWERRPRLTQDDARAVRERLTVPALVATETYGGGSVSAGGGTTVENVWLTAATADIFRIRDMDVAVGRTFTDPEDRMGTAVVVLGHDTADKLFGTLDPMGREVRISGQSFAVIGVLEKQGSLFGMSLDNRAIAPAGSPMRRVVSPRGYISEVLIRAPDEQAMARAMVETEAIMRVLHRLRPGDANSFEIETASDSMAFWTRISTILMIAFPFLVGISLVVGGMVIMNIMLMSVTERIREIGVRKALGARRRDVLTQILIESATLSGVGAGVGIAFGVVLAKVVAAASPLPAAIAPFWIVVASVMGIGVGVIAGLYPASRAARLDPVVALRYE